MDRVSKFMNELSNIEEQVEFSGITSITSNDLMTLEDERSELKLSPFEEKSTRERIEALYSKLNSKSKFMKELSNMEKSVKNSGITSITFKDLLRLEDERSELKLSPGEEVDARKRIEALYSNLVNPINKTGGTLRRKKRNRKTKRRNSYR